MPIEASVIAENKFVEVGVDVPSAEAVIGAERPSLHEREDAVDLSENDMPGGLADDGNSPSTGPRAGLRGPEWWRVEEHQEADLLTVVEQRDKLDMICRKLRLQPGEIQVWDVPQAQPGRLQPAGPVGRVVSVDPMGHVLDDVLRVVLGPQFLRQGCTG